MDRKEIKPVNPKGNHPEYSFTGRTDAEASVIRTPDMKSLLTDAGKDWGQKNKGVAEDEMVR